MPAVSDAQRRLLYARYGPDGVKKHHFDTVGKLPEHVAKQTLARRKRKAR